MRHDRVVYWSDEDNCYIGLCPSLFYGGVHGASEKRVRAQLESVIRDWETPRQVCRPRQYAKKRVGYARARRH